MKLAGTSANSGMKRSQGPIFRDMYEKINRNLFRRRVDIARFWRVCRQAPWRTQTQAVAAWAVFLLIAAVVGGLYLAAASRAGVAGRDLQFLEARREALIRSNDELRAHLAAARSIRRLANRAREMGFVPVQPHELEYLPVPNYPQPPAQSAELANLSPAMPPAPANWFLHTLGSLLPGGG